MATLSEISGVSIVFLVIAMIAVGFLLVRFQTQLLKFALLSVAAVTMFTIYQHYPEDAPGARDIVQLAQDKISTIDAAKLKHEGLKVGSKLKDLIEKQEKKAQQQMARSLESGEDALRQMGNSLSPRMQQAREEIQKLSEIEQLSEESQEPFSRPNQPARGSMGRQGGDSVLEF